MPSRDVTEFRENGKSTLIVVEYKPLLPAFVTVDYIYTYIHFIDAP